MIVTFLLIIGFILILISIVLYVIYQYNSTIKELKNLKQQVNIYKDYLIQEEQNFTDLQNMIAQKTKEMSKIDEYIEIKNRNIISLAAVIDNQIAKKDNIQEQLNEVQKQYEDIQAALVIGLEEKRKKNLNDDRSLYQLLIMDNEKSDIAKLKELRFTFSQPRIISKLIWSTFYQTKLTQLCNKVVGAKKKTGIYKLTNITTDEVYIGQAVDIAERWKQHAKYGCGIDTPANNKLYQSMNKYGLENFTWEILEECGSTDLNQKEARYIDLFKSVEYGLNTLRGKK